MPPLYPVEPRIDDPIPGHAGAMRKDQADRQPDVVKFRIPDRQIVRVIDVNIRSVATRETQRVEHPALGGFT